MLRERRFYPPLGGEAIIFPRFGKRRPRRSLSALSGTFSSNAPLEEKEKGLFSSFLRREGVTVGCVMSAEFLQYVNYEKVAEFFVLFKCETA
jgi:hypothetical protein